MSNKLKPKSSAPGKIRNNPRAIELILECMAFGLGAPNIVNELDELLGIDVSIKNVHACYVKNPKYQRMAEDLRASFSGDLFKIPIANRCTRLNILEKAVKIALRGVDRTVYYGKDGKVDRIEYRQNLAGISQLIREARSETEQTISPDHAEKMSLLSIIKDFYKNKNGAASSGGNGKKVAADTNKTSPKAGRAGSSSDLIVDPGVPGQSDRVGEQGSKGYEIL